MALKTQWDKSKWSLIFERPNRRERREEEKREEEEEEEKKKRNTSKVSRLVTLETHPLPLAG